MPSQFHGRATPGGREPGYPRGIVTGGSSGIGAAIIAELSGSIRLVDLSRTSGSDVRDARQVRRAFDVFCSTEGVPEVLVNCAGIVVPAPLLGSNPHAVAAQIETNLEGTLRCSEAFAARVLGAGGRGVIVNVGSTSGSRPSPGWGVYAATKAAVASLTATMVAEWGPAIRTYCIEVGRTATPLRARIAPGEDPADAMAPEQVAATVRALIFDDGDGLLTGQSIRVRRPA